MKASRNAIVFYLALAAIAVVTVLACNLGAVLSEPTVVPSPQAIPTLKPVIQVQTVVVPATIAATPTPRTIYVVRTTTPPPPVVIHAPTATPVPGPTIDFHLDKPVIQAGDCAVLKWDVEHVMAVYLDGEGVVGHSEKAVCPGKTTVYTLHVELVLGYVDRALTLLVLPRPTALPGTVP